MLCLFGCTAWSEASSFGSYKLGCLYGQQMMANRCVCSVYRNLLAARCHVPVGVLGDSTAMSTLADTCSMNVDTSPSATGHPGAPCTSRDRCQYGTY